ncbi:MAG: FAD:protein FMN transferase [Phycisphaerae bacterium]|nr:FAD:protein FMN transferase [Phycisphaerae bacterium]NIP55163.1 FAD:protein FMN transferase [Phycisphaerae bacterium]NIS53575.1 FAD:protein FMN transferase [Phycisphaerae bacterium]NIU11467.1 FAD:protein FMN transferase [Phycisphaerae bacterium]NIU55548.1 FAD:protein FMN transferase [Phycisphaerae bacterium]
MCSENIKTVRGFVFHRFVKYNPLVLLAAVSLIATVMVPLLLSLRGQGQHDSGYRLVMGTFAHLKAIAKDQETAKNCVESAFEELQKVDDLMSDYKSDSEISEVNRDSFSRAVKVSKSTLEVLQKSVEFSRLSEGAFDITIAPLADLWRSAAEVNSIPTGAELAVARSKVGYEKLLLDANEMTVRFAVEGMKLDLGGIAKGYAIDRAVEAMQAGGSVGGMVDVGGDIRCFGKPPRGKKTWRIGLENPAEIKGGDEILSAGADRLLLILKLNNAAIATSGGYRRYVLIEGKMYSHIMDRDTGTSAQGMSSVTIISQSAINADALATAVSVMGFERGLSLIERTPQTEAILITPSPEYQLIKTTGAGRYVSD